MDWRFGRPRHADMSLKARGENATGKVLVGCRNWPPSAASRQQEQLKCGPQRPFTPGMNGSRPKSSTPVCSGLNIMEPFSRTHGLHNETVDRS